MAYSLSGRRRIRCWGDGASLMSQRSSSARAVSSAVLLVCSVAPIHVGDCLHVVTGPQARVNSCACASASPSPPVITANPKPPLCVPPSLAWSYAPSQ
eukprot:2448025-Rhodomonas_salina.3